MPRTPRLALRLAVSVLLPLVVLWLVRPLFHGLVMFFWTSPIVWLPPLTVIAIGALARRRAAGPRPPHPAAGGARRCT